MKKKVTLKLVIGILLMILGYESYSFIDELMLKKEVLENVKTVDIFDNKDKTLSIMIQDSSDGSYEFKPTPNRNSWPSTNEYLYAGVKCTDASGKDIGDTTPYIRFDESDYTVTITTKKTIYCTLYFANGRPALEVLDKQGGTYYAGGQTGAKKVLVDELYRFVGTKDQVTNNYICLGASENPDTCKSDVNNMYRIIGVTTDGRLKVIKASPISEKLKWYKSQTADAWWDMGPAYTYLNGDFYNSINERIKSHIEYHTWNREDYRQTTWPSTNPTSSSISVGQVSNYIGLMYATDFVNAYQNNSVENWLVLEEGAEWTMTKSYQTYGVQYAWVTSYVGALGGGTPLDSDRLVRPVFYLQNDVGVVGLGTESSPYTITTIK